MSKLVRAVAPAMLLLALGPHAQADDFNPAGRKKGTGQSQTSRPTESTPRPKAGSRTPAPSAPSEPHASGRALSSPGSAALIERYTAVVLAEPQNAGALDRLMQLYRERDGNTRALLAQMEQRASRQDRDRYAALVVVGSLQRQDGHLEEARSSWKEAQQARSKEAVPWMLLAALAQEQGDAAGARALYEKALPLQGTTEQEQTLRVLLGLCLDAKDFASAERLHASLVRLSGGSGYVRGELGRELAARGEYARAEEELSRVVAESTGDNRALLPALRDLGSALLKERKYDGALLVLQRALRASTAEAGAQKEVLARMTEAYRAQNQLTTWIARLEKEPVSRVQKQSQLGALYEETGQIEQALHAYRNALDATGGRDIDLRIKIIRLLQSQGDLEQATHEYESLVRGAPRNTEYVFELCEILMQRGEKSRALRELSALEQRARGDSELAARLADFYDHIDEKERAQALLSRLVAVDASNPQHLIDLGDRLYQQGDKKHALETWARIRSVVQSRAKALSILGEVYLEHDLAVEALEALREASNQEPDNVAYQKQYASALERTAATAGGALFSASRYDQARAIWEKLLGRSVTDRNLAREARQHLVTLWGLLHQLELELPILRKRFASATPDVEAGRLLAEVLLHLRRTGDARVTLERLVSLLPGDTEAHLALERAWVLEHNLPLALTTLEKLVSIDPKRAREYYQRMAQYAAELYRDEDAIRYAARAVALSPDDAEGHRKLGEMYKKRQSTAEAIAEFRLSLVKNDKAYPVYFELAELLMGENQVDQADDLYRQIMRNAPDDELIAEAARLSLQIHIARGTEERLEHDLLPLALGNPRKPVYRRLLVELYGSLSFPLIQQVRYGNAQEAAEAKARLSALGTHAVKPLLDALGDEKPSAQRIALDLLGFVNNRSAGPALFAYARGDADLPLRLSALLACGALRDPALLPRYRELLLRKDKGSDEPLELAASWGVSRMGHRDGAPLLRRLLQEPSPETRAIAALGLGFLHDTPSEKALRDMAGAAESGNVARAAAAFALGELPSPKAAETLLRLSGEREQAPRSMALLALARLRPIESATKEEASKAARDPAKDAIARALLSVDAPLREGALAAALVWSTGQYRAPLDPLAPPEGTLDVRAALARLLPRTYSNAEKAMALVAFSPELEAAARSSALRGEDEVLAFLSSATVRDGRTSLLPFLEHTDGIPQATLEEAWKASERIAEAHVPAFIALAGHPSSGVRARAVQFLAARRDPDAQRAVARALSDTDEGVVLQALASLDPGTAGDDVPRTVVGILKASKSWNERAQSAEALGRLGSRAKSADVLAALSRAAEGDPYALVREACVRAASAIDRVALRDTLRRLAQNDPEPRIRALAVSLTKE